MYDNNFIDEDLEAFFSDFFAVKIKVNGTFIYAFRDTFREPFSDLSSNFLNSDGEKVTLLFKTKDIKDLNINEETILTLYDDKFTIRNIKDNFDGTTRGDIIWLNNQ